MSAWRVNSFSCRHLVCRLWSNGSRWVFYTAWLTVVYPSTDNYRY